MAEFDFHSIVRFIKQAQSSELSTKSYPSEYLGLSVKVSFGIGNVAKVPWIAILGHEQLVSNGIYPVYLYYKRLNVLILAYGVSDSNASIRKWAFKERHSSIGEYFTENNLDKPDRYKESYVCKAYSLIPDQENFGLKENMVINDLNQIVSDFQEQFAVEKPKTNVDILEPIMIPVPRPISKTIITRFADDINKAGLNISDNIGIRFVSSLLTKPFVILTGLSGSGKTKLAQAFASWICESDEQYRIIPVGADWTNREPLLGYPNALEPEKYVYPDCGSLELILNAMKPENQNKPFFLILDEMNMSHVERYFADFLSAMESGEPILLHPGKEPKNNIPGSVAIPNNLFIVGTVNIDETTYMFSPKVLDRANVIEFRVTKEEMQNYIDSATALDMSILKHAGASMAVDFMQVKLSATVNNMEGIATVLIEFFAELKRIGAEYGYRTAAEIVRFCNLVKLLDDTWTTDQIMDAAIMQKLLPKVHGSRRKLEPVLRTLGAICLEPNEQKTLEELFSFKTDLDSVRDKLKYPVSMEKILRMYRGLTDNGFTSYAEA